MMQLLILILLALLAFWAGQWIGNKVTR